MLWKSFVMTRKRFDAKSETSLGVISYVQTSMSRSSMTSLSKLVLVREYHQRSS